MIDKNKFILDACCSGRMMWFNKKHPNTLYIDIRNEPPGLCKERPNFSVQPDIVMDFRKLDLPDKCMKLVVWDPPHGTRFSKTSIMAKKFGVLNKDTWKEDLQQGFKEIWRVLDDHGVLVFKWNDTSIKYKEVLKQFDKDPLFYNITAGPKNRNVLGNRTYWFCFMKIPEANK